MDRQTSDSLISIMTSSEGTEILKSIVSACQNLQANESTNTKPKKFNMLESLFYGELYEIGRSLQRAVDESGSTLPEEVQEDLDNFMFRMAEHNIIGCAKNRALSMYDDIGASPPTGESTIDILRDLHHEGTQTHRFFLTSCVHAYDSAGPSTLRNVAGSYPGSVAKVYIGDKKTVSITLKALSVDNWRVGSAFPLPMIVVSRRDLDLYYPNAAISDKDHNETEAWSFFQAGNNSRCKWIEKRNLTNNTTTFIPEISYVAPNDNTYTSQELNLVLDDTVLDNGNVNWLYVGLDDYNLEAAGIIPRILEVTITSEYDNYYVRT